MSVRRQSVTASLAGVPVTVDSVTYEHGVSLRAGDVVGSDATVAWGEGAGVIRASQVQNPFAPGWTRTNGKSVTIDVTDDGTPHRVFSGQIEDSSGSLVAGSSSNLVDAIKRLNTKVSLPPLAWTMGPRPDVSGAGLRRPGLYGVWFTHLAMMQAGYHPCQAAQTSSVYSQTFSGSGWTTPNPDHTVDTLGHLTRIQHQDNALAVPVVVQGTNVPCMEKVSSLGSTITRRNSGVEAWQVTVDMASDAPTVFHTGRVDLRPLPVASGAGVRLDWTQTVLRVYRIDGDGTLTSLGSVARAVDGVYTMRWTAVVRPDGTLTIHGSGGRLNALSLSGTGITMPTGPGRGTVAVESEGPVSHVQVTRSDSTFLVTQAVSARIHRSTFSNRRIDGFDYVPPTPAMDVLADQADAERGLGGMPIWMWIDEDGRLRNADAAWLWAQARKHTFTNAAGGGIALDEVGWSVPADGPHSRVDVRCRFANVTIRTSPTLLLAVGGQKNHDNGDLLDEFLHPNEHSTWLQPDVWAYLAGNPLPPPGDTEYNRGWGTWVGGMRVNASDGDRVGWITIGDISGWSVDAANHVQGALAVLDHRTILYKGTVATGSAYGMSSMPDQASVGLWEHRKTQPLPQIRGWGRIDWTEGLTSVPGPGGELDPVLDHDGGMWVQNSVWRQQVAEILAATSANPLPEMSLTVAVDPSVRVGDRALVVVAYPDGATLTVEGLVAGVRATVPSSEDVMTVRLVGVDITWVDGDGSLGGSPSPIGEESGVSHDDTPPQLTPHPPPSTDPPVTGE